MKLLIFLTFFNSIFIFGNTYNILAIFGSPIKSHYNAFIPLLEKLSSSNNMTIVSYYPQHVKTTSNTTNIHEIDLGDRQLGIQKSVTVNIKDHISNPGFLRDIRNWIQACAHAMYAGNNNCKTLIRNKEIQYLVKEKLKFDVVLVEQFTSDCELGLASWFDAPIVGITSHVLLPWTLKKLAIPFNVATDPFYYSSGGWQPSLYQRIDITIRNSLMNNFFLKFFIHKPQEKYLFELLGVKPNLEEIGNNLSLVLASQHFTLNGPRVLTPHVIEVGGMHIKENKSLLQDLHKLVSEAKHGVIYVSFGSIIKASSMPSAIIQEMLSVFAKLHQIIIWKWDEDEISGAPENVFVKKWLPQTDLLCSGNIVAFISHGGLLGTMEAVHCGVPTIVIPFYGDQFSNAASVRDSGLGNFIFIEDLRKDSLAAALNDVMGESRRSRVKELYRNWHARPAPPVETAAYWVEWAVQHRLQRRPSPGILADSQMDVYIILASSAILFIYFLAKTIKFLARFFSQSKVKVKSS